MTPSKKNNSFFDDALIPSEQIPRSFSVVFMEVGTPGNDQVRVVVNDLLQLGDVINDNSYHNDFYRYHDVFHYSFATMLGWSPCTRAMMKRKRKSNANLDKIEDGARAAITEEAICMIVFNEAKRKKFFSEAKKVSKITLRIIKEMTENLEVQIRTSKEWEIAILKAYEIFRSLIYNKGGRVHFNMADKEIVYISVK